VSETFAQPRLAEMGIIDAAALQQSWHDYKNRGVGSGGHLYVVFQVELWLSTRTGTPVIESESPRQLLRMPAAGFLQSVEPV
jgi:hypothetical protein